MLAGGQVDYDYLVLAAGATHSYFGHDEWEPLAPGLKSLEDATEIRKRILLAFETAEYEGSEETRQRRPDLRHRRRRPDRRRARGAIEEIAAKTIPTTSATSTPPRPASSSSEGGDRLLAQFTPDLSNAARRDLGGWASRSG